MTNMNNLPDYTKAHPALKQQYTFKDLQAAFKAGEDLIGHDWHMQEFHGTRCQCTPPSYNSFEDWWKQFKFEMTDENNYNKITSN
jgi:hypothetical protein